MTSLSATLTLAFSITAFVRLNFYLVGFEYDLSGCVIVGVFGAAIVFLVHRYAFETEKELPLCYD
jgi:hypothetical protein